MPFDLPRGWAWARLEYLFRFIDYRGKTPHKIQDGIPLVTAKNVRQGYIDYSISEFISYDEFSQRRSRGVSHKGDILFTTEAPLGYVAIADLDVFSTGQRLITLQRYGDTDNLCIMHFMQSKFWQEYLYSKKTGTTVAGIKAEYLKEMLVPLPPLAEQKRIVAKIEELFAIADSLGVAVDGLENAAKRLDKKILDLAIRGKLVPQDPNDEPASELVKRIAASHKSPSKNQSEPIDPPFEIPQSWEWVRLKELGVFCGGHTPSTSNPKLWGGDILWVSSKDMKSKYIDDTQLKVTRLGAEELNVLKPGALLMCTRSGILRRVFPVAIARRELTINQDQRALTLWLPEMIEYVYLALKALESIILSDYKKSGTTVESIIWNKFVDLPIPLPPLNEQKRIVKRVEALKATTRTLVTF